MIPKGKSKQLYYKYWEIQESKHEIAKKYALIAVDEILKYINRMNKMLPQHLSTECWQEVKQEI